jgi:hypothetical protein
MATSWSMPSAVKVAISPPLTLSHSFTVLSDDAEKSLFPFVLLGYSVEPEFCVSSKGIPQSQCRRPLVSQLVLAGWRMDGHTGRRIRARGLIG